MLNLYSLCTEYRKEVAVTLNQAVIKRIEEICEETDRSVCDICLSAGLTPSTVYELLYGRTKQPGIITTKLFCEGAGNKIKEFFDRDYFDDLED